MRPPSEQEHFLEYGRFGERSKWQSMNALVKVGIAFLGTGCACLGFLVLLPDLGEPGALLVAGPMVHCALIGALLCVCGLLIGNQPVRDSPGWRERK